MTILITGASGQLGRLVLDSLLERGVAASDIVAGTRTPEGLAAFADRGVRVVEFDYSDPATIAAAIKEVDRVLLISGAGDDRYAGHRNVITAAKDAGVAQLVYTSAPKATSTDFSVAYDHRLTEEAIVDSGVAATIIRNNWYTENYTFPILGAAESGVISAAAGQGRVASASRKDFADAAAVVLTEDGHIGQVYELGGDVSWTYDDLAAAASDVLGRPVEYVAVDPAELTANMIAAGTPAAFASFAASVDEGIAKGALAGDSDRTLSRLIGRPTTPLVDGLRAAVAAATE